MRQVSCFCGFSRISQENGLFLITLSFQNQYTKVSSYRNIKFDGAYMFFITIILKILTVLNMDQDYEGKNQKNPSPRQMIKIYIVSMHPTLSL